MPSILMGKWSRKHPPITQFFGTEIKPPSRTFPLDIWNRSDVSVIVVNLFSEDVMV